MLIRPMLILAGIILTMLVVYGAALNLHGLWGDELTRLAVINGEVVQSGSDFRGYGPYAGLFKQLTGYLYQPAWYVLQHEVGNALSCNSETCLRSVNVATFALCLTALFVFMANLPLGARFVALVACTFNGAMMMFVIQVREYPLILLSLTFSAAIVASIYDRYVIQGHRPRFVVGALYVGSLLLAFFSHLFTVFFLISHLIAIWVAGPQGRRLALFFLGTSAIAALMALPYILHPDFLQKLQASKAHWDLRTPAVPLLLDHLGFGLTSVLFGGGLFWVDFVPRSTVFMSGSSGGLGAPSWMAKLVLAYLPSLAALVVLVLLAARRQGRTPGDRMRLWMVGAPTVLFACFQVVQAMTHDLQIVWARFFFMYLFPMAYLVGEAYAGLDGVVYKPLGRRIARAAFGGVVLFSSVSQVTYHFRRSTFDLGCDMRVAVQGLTAMIEDRAPVLSDHVNTIAAYSYYDRTGRRAYWLPGPIAPVELPPGPFWWVTPAPPEEALAFLKRAFSKGTPVVAAAQKDSCNINVLRIENAIP